nr:alpha/beta hydrolase [Marinicella sp. W31]MDC2875823.1 alpha/beta hydrolase [Marinicella sp. W31]
MAAHFRALSPVGITTRDDRVDGVPVRLYGTETETVIIFAHGGGFVLGGLESHDDVCTEIAATTGFQVVAVDYRLAPEHKHPAAYDDVLAVARTLCESHAVVLCGDSAGATLCAAIAGTWTAPELKGQVLIYPSLGFAPEGGSFERHAHAPLLTRAELQGYSDVRGGTKDDPSATPKAGNLAQLPPTRLFPAECDPLHDDSVRYRDTALEKGADVTLETGAGLVHGWLRARHKSARASAQFALVTEALTALCRS